MWQYRELVSTLTIVELKNRYQNTALGFFWSILGPFLLATVLYFVFSTVFSQEENFAANVLVGIMAWRFFAGGTGAALYSIVGKPSLVTKVYIPRKILTLSTALSVLISSTLEFIILLPIIFVLTGGIPVTVLLFPLVSLLYFWLIFGASLVLAALFVYFRDLNQIWDVVIFSGFFLSPIVYPLSRIPDSYMTYYLLNPITRLIIMYREVMIAGNLPSIGSLIVVIGWCVILFIIGNLVFNKLQRRFAEAI